MRTSDLFDVIESVSNEYSIGKNLVLDIAKEAIFVIAEKCYGERNELSIDVDNTGKIAVSRKLIIVSDDTRPDPYTEICLRDVAKNNPSLLVGEAFIELLPDILLDRGSVARARSVVLTRFKEADKKSQFDLYKDRIGLAVSGIVKRKEMNSVIIALADNVEAVIYRNGQLVTDNYRSGDRIRAVIVDVRYDLDNYQIILSRTDNSFLEALFMQEVQEMYAGTVQIISIAREPGFRAKVAVFSRDSSVDPVGACIGMRASRIRSIIDELNGEKIDVIPYSEDFATFVVEVLAPATIDRIIIDEDRHVVQAIVPESQLSIAIGRGGQNVRLASRIMKWNVEIMTDEQEIEARNNDIDVSAKLLIDALEIDEIAARLLISEGLDLLQDILDVDDNELASLLNIDSNVVEKIKAKASAYLVSQNAHFGNDDNIGKLKINTDLLNALYSCNIDTVGKLSDLSIDEIKDLLPADLVFEDKVLGDAILHARSRLGVLE